MSTVFVILFGIFVAADLYSIIRNVIMERKSLSNYSNVLNNLSNQLADKNRIIEKSNNDFIELAREYNKVKAERDALIKAKPSKPKVNAKLKSGEEVFVRPLMTPVDIISGQEVVKMEYFTKVQGVLKLLSTNDFEMLNA